METIEISRTIKSRIIFQNSQGVIKMVESQEAFRQGCNFVSEYMFDNGFPMNTTTLVKLLYNDLRSKFGLKSQMAQSCVRNVIARYRSVQTQLRKERVWDGYKKDNHGKQVKNYVNKDLEFLWKPIEFKRPQLDLVRNRDYSHKDDNTMSLNTIYGRVIVKPIFNGWEQYFDGSWTLGTAKVLKSGKHWYLHIAVTKEVEEPEFKLSHVTFNTVSKRAKKHRYEHHSWAFYDFEQKLSYKAFDKGSQVVSCDAHYTSQRCPKCGYIDSKNRNKNKHEFCCKACSYRTNDDRAAAMNIQFLGTLYNSGNPKPAFEKLELNN